MNVHFIAIGGSAMHNIALALHDKGYTVTGSDDQIFEPSRTRLQQAGILPEKDGWFPEKITNDLDAVILGMHARVDNPELLAAKEKGVKVYSYPEFLYQQTRDKKRVVIAGSHGKTSITSMILHVLQYHDRPCDFMVGAQLDGFDRMVSLEKDTDIAIFEGDEYLSSPIDRRPKFFHYQPHVALISGIAWDHINVFPTFDGYVDQFRQFAHSVEAGGELIWFEGDEHLQTIVQEGGMACRQMAYRAHPHAIEHGHTYLMHDGRTIPVKIFGRHNMENLEGARLVCESVGISRDEFYEAIATFTGAARRLELLESTMTTSIYRDFAHSPSKLKATTAALKSQYPDRTLVACMELHTFSSLSAEFLDHYRDTMKDADRAIVFFNPEALAHKKLPMITKEQVKSGFGGNVEVITNTVDLQALLYDLPLEDVSLLLMSSGNFGGMDIPGLAQSLIQGI
ncbi:MAG: peptidoglycan synthetase [Flavobacteriales bacterium]|nr:peptidoglycan synthetase [Flavobacteriales bacterium]